MKRKVISFILVAVLACAGCASFRKKFTPPKPEKPKQVKFYYIAEQDYALPDNQALYRRYYAYWRGWESDLIQYLSANLLADRRHGQEALDNLEKMLALLNAEGAAKLKPYVDELSAAFAKINEGRLSGPAAERLKDDLNRHKRRVEKEFVYSKIADFVRKDHGQTNN